MPKRPRAHIIEDKAGNFLKDRFFSEGWAVEDLNQDYGEDFLVRIFESHKATPWSFFVQSKATDKMKKHLLKNGKFISFRIESQHVLHWRQFWEPVLLIVFDVSRRVAYWEVIQDSLGKTDLGRQKTVAISIPLGNVLNKEGLRRIKARTKKRFERFEEQRRGAQILIEELKEKWDMDVKYYPDAGLLMLPAGYFVADTSRDVRVTVFGRLAVTLERLVKRTGIKPGDLLVNASKLFIETISQIKSGESIVVRDSKSGKILEEIETVEELKCKLDRLLDLGKV
jgi:hypothetical protein